MGYYASGSGSAKLKKGTDKEALAKILDGIESGIGFSFYVNGEYDYIDMCHEYEKWYDDETDEFLSALIPYIEDGDMSFSGEDDCYWRYVFKPEEGKWEYEYARIVYDLSDFSDEELMAEVIKRCLIAKK